LFSVSIERVSHVLKIDLAEILRCPACGGALEDGPSTRVCIECGATYSEASGRPILITSTNAIFPPSSYGADAKSHPSSRRCRPSLSATRDLSRARSLETLSQRASQAKPVLIIGSGDQRQQVRDALGPNLAVVCTDVAVDADVDVFADAHELPFRDNAFSAVVATAVLEHVLDPMRVMREIVRVTEAEGLLYSEVPFMQQVHEGPHDFTRFTLSGHHRLVNAYDVLDSGAAAGPLTALLWAIEHAALALGGWRQPKVAKGLVRMAFCWLSILDGRVAQRPAALDGASCTYVLGHLRRSGEVQDEDIVEGYRGAQQRLR